MGDGLRKGKCSKGLCPVKDRLKRLLIQIYHSDGNLCVKEGSFLVHLQKVYSDESSFIRHLSAAYDRLVMTGQL